MVHGVPSLKLTASVPLKIGLLLPKRKGICRGLGYVSFREAIVCDLVCWCLHPSRTMPSPLRMTRAAPWLHLHAGLLDRTAVRRLANFQVAWASMTTMWGTAQIRRWPGWLILQHEFHVAKKRTFPNPETSFCKFAPENRQTWPQKASNLPTIHFQWRTVSFGEGNYFYQESLDLSNLADQWGFLWLGAGLWKWPVSTVGLGKEWFKDIESLSNDSTSWYGNYPITYIVSYMIGWCRIFSQQQYQLESAHQETKIT